MDTANVVVSGQEPTTLSNSDWSDFVEASTLAVFTSRFGQLNVSGESPTLVVGEVLNIATGLVSVQGYQPFVQAGSSISLSVEAGFGLVEVSGLQAVTFAGVGGDAGTSTINVQGQSPEVITSDEASTVVGTTLVTVQGYSPNVSVISNQHITVGSSSILVTGNQINFVYVSRETPDRRRVKVGSNRSISISLHSRKLKILPKQ